jgi:hypothetical protein
MEILICGRILDSDRGPSDGGIALVPVRANGKGMNGLPLSAMAILQQLPIPGGGEL